MKKQLLLIAAVAVALFTSCGSSEPTNTIEEVAIQNIEYTYAGDIDATLELCHATDEEKAMVKQIWEAAGKQALEQRLEEYGPIASIEVTEKNVSEDGIRATLKIAVTFEDGTVIEEPGMCILVDNTWMIGQ